MGHEIGSLLKEDDETVEVLNPLHIYIIYILIVKAKLRLFSKSAPP
jgi:hypothetical protein